MMTVLPPVNTTTACASSIPVTVGSCPASPTVVFSVPAGNLGPGNVVFVETQVEFDHGAAPFQHVVHIARKLIRATSPTDTTGVLVNEEIMGDAGPGEWSYVFSLMGVDSAIPTGEGYCYNVVLSAYSPSASGGESLTIPPGYGNCSILVMQQ